MGLSEDIRAAEDAARDQVIADYAGQKPDGGIVAVQAGDGIGLEGTGAIDDPLVITNTKPESGGDSPPPATVTSPGVRLIDSFEGGSDADKFQNYLNYAAAQTYGPAGVFPERRFDLGGRTYVVPEGMKLIGAGIPFGPKNREQGTNNVSGEVHTGAGEGANSTFVFRGNVYGVTVVGISFALDGQTQLFDSADGNVYSAEFNSLSIYGGKHVFGSRDRKFLNTFCHFTGIGTAVANQDMFAHFGGSDSWFWRNGSINLGPHQGTDMNDTPLVWFDHQSKSFVGGIYDTSDQNARALLVTGGDLDLDGGVYEGFKDNDPIVGTAIRVNGGFHTFRAQRIAYAGRNPDPDEHGVIDIIDGTVSLEGIKYDRGSTSADYPLINVRAGNVAVRRVMGFGFQPVVRREGGVVSVDGSVRLVGGEQDD